MTADAGPGLIRVVWFGRASALLTGIGAVLSEGLLPAFVRTSHRPESLLMATVAFTLTSLTLLPLGFRLPARLRRHYEQAARIGAVDASRDAQDAARRRSLRRTAGFVGVLACWMMLMAIASHELMPPVLLVPVAVGQWGRSRATAAWERRNGVVLWQAAPGFLGVRGPVYRVPAADGT